MPMPLWWGTINKHVFNRIELRRGERPVLAHVGRISGTAYRTPLEIIPIDGGFFVHLMYGPGGDWTRNVLAAGSATVEMGGETIEVTNPRIVDRAEIEPLVPADTTFPPDFLKVTKVLRVDRGASTTIRE